MFGKNKTFTNVTPTLVMQQGVESGDSGSGCFPTKRGINECDRSHPHRD